MKIIWAPWRMVYIDQKKSPGCILCDKPGENKDDENFIIYRGKYSFVLLNTFPYNPGHLMVAPYRHLSKLDELTVAEANEHFDIIRLSTRNLRETMNPAGFNIGINLGRDAGAGIFDHIHSHIVPRWRGDSNYMPVISDTKVIPQALGDTYRRLKTVFQKSAP